MGTRDSGSSHGAGESGTLYGDVPADGKLSPSAEADAIAQATMNVSWDPYQVWLTRVKQPREQVARQRSQERAEEHAPLPSTDTSDTARLRTLSAAIPG